MAVFGIDPVDSHGWSDEHDELAAQLRNGGVDPGAPRTQLLVKVVRQMLGVPRHLGQHTGGMVIAARGDGG